MPNKDKTYPIPWTIPSLQQYPDLIELLQQDILFRYFHEEYLDEEIIQQYFDELKGKT